MKNYLKTREYTYYTCRNGRLQQLEQKDRKNKKKNKVVDGEGMTLQTIVIDDLQFLREIEDREQILSMIRDEAYWVILISRSSLLPWLKTIYMNEGMMQITEEELIWRCQDVATYWQKHNEEALSEAQVNEIHDFSKGNPLSIRSIAKLSLDHGGYDPEYLKQSWCDFEDYLIEQLMREWDINLINF